LAVSKKLIVYVEQSEKYVLCLNFSKDYSLDLWRRYLARIGLSKIRIYYDDDDDDYRGFMELSLAGSKRKSDVQLTKFEHEFVRRDKMRRSLRDVTTSAWMRHELINFNKSILKLNSRKYIIQLDWNQNIFDGDSIFRLVSPKETNDSVQLTHNFGIGWVTQFLRKHTHKKKVAPSYQMYMPPRVRALFAC
jgi:hypothetical protein